MRVATANIKSLPLMSEAKVRHDVREVAAAASLVGWQEIRVGKPSYYRQAIADLGADWHHFFPTGEAGTNPISWRHKDWILRDKGFVFAHGGLAHVSPSRHISWVILEHRATGRVVAFWTTQYVSGAWTRAFRPYQPWRKDRWRKHRAVNKALVLKLENDPRVDFVIGGGDINRSGNRFLGDLVKYDTKLGVGTLGRPGSVQYDYLTHVPNLDLSVNFVSKVKLPRPFKHIVRGLWTNHDALVVQYWWKA